MTSSLKILAVLLMFATAAFGSDISGTVTNKTSNKASSGDEVVLLKLGQGGMEEAGRTKTDASGKFSFKNVDASSPHLVRVIHQAVTYHAQVPPGGSTANVDVYDAARKIDKITATVQVMRLQAQGNTLQATELYAVKNDSSPPRTLMADQTFNIILPEGAQVDGGEAVSGSGLPVNSAPVPATEKNHYFFVFPLRPGETRFQVSYHLPYTGEASLNEKILYPMEHFVVMVPKAMQFTPGDPAQFQLMPPDQGDPGATTMVSSAVKPGDSLAFKVGGTGTFPAENDQQAEGGAGADNRPGGGLGPPSEAPDPLHKYRWYILGALVVAMSGGAFYVLSKRPPLPAEGAAAAAQVAAMPASTARPGRVTAASNGRSGMLLEALKEELFQLEVDRAEGRISDADYAKAKSALDVTIARAIKRGTPAAKTQNV